MKKYRVPRRSYWLAAMMLACAIVCVSVICYLKPYIKGNLSNEQGKAIANKNYDKNQTGEVVENPIDFAALTAINSDIYAYIVIPGVTDIEANADPNGGYPVLQSSTDKASPSYNNDNYYLDHNIDYSEGYPGCIYSQYKNAKDFSNPVTVLYGHDMRNDTMFGSLHYFYEIDGFFTSHDKMYIYTPGHILTYTIFAAYRSGNQNIMNTYDFNNIEDLQDYQSTCLNPKYDPRSVRQGVSLSPSEKILTLSTCINNDKYRYLVQGVLINDQVTK